MFVLIVMNTTLFKLGFNVPEQFCTAADVLSLM